MCSQFISSETIHIFILQVKTTHTSTLFAKFMEGLTKGTSSSSTHDTSGEKTDRSTRSKTHQDTSFMARSSASSPMLSDSSTDDQASHSRDAASERESVSSSSASDTRSKTSSSKYTDHIADKKQLSYLKTQHLVQLIGILKRSSDITENASKSRALHRMEAMYKKPRCFGLFMMQNHVYLTRLSVKSSHTVDDRYSRYAERQFIQNLGRMDADGRLIGEVYSIPLKQFSLEYKIAEGYLDIYKPKHVKALINYLCIIFWHEQQIYTGDTLV